MSKAIRASSRVGAGKKRGDDQAADHRFGNAVRAQKLMREMSNRPTSNTRIAMTSVSVTLTSIRKPFSGQRFEALRHLPQNRIQFRVERQLRGEGETEAFYLDRDGGRDDT